MIRRINIGKQSAHSERLRVVCVQSFVQALQGLTAERNELCRRIINRIKVDPLWSDDCFDDIELGHIHCMTDGDVFVLYRVQQNTVVRAGAIGTLVLSARLVTLYHVGTFRIAEDGSYVYDNLPFT